MARVITVMNMKGGVGKTTVTMHIAGVFARYRVCNRPWRVLAIDYDPQFNLSQAFIPAVTYYKVEAQRKTCLSILLDDESKVDPYELKLPGKDEPPEPGDLVHNIFRFTDAVLDLVPSTLDLMYVALGQTDKRTKPIEQRFATFIGQCRKHYDLIFIDCHPAGSLLTKTSLTNSDHVIIPVAPQPYAVRGVGLMMEFIKAAHAAAPPEAHILFNLSPRGGSTAEEGDLRANPKLAAKCMATSMRRYKAFSGPMGGSGFCWSGGKPYMREATRNLLAIARELCGRIGMGAEA